MDPSINSIVNARRRFASVMHLYPRSGENQPTMPIDRFDRIICTTYETIVDVHRFPVEQIQICIDKEAGKLIVCGYREGDVPQFGFKSDFFKELDIPLGVDMDSITATYEECGYVHFSLPCSQKKKVKGRELAITPVGLRSTAGLTLSSRKNDRNCCTAPVSYTIKGSPDTPIKITKTESFNSKGAGTLYSAKSTGNLSSFDSNRTIWDKPYNGNTAEKQVVNAPVKLQLSSASFSNCKPPEKTAVSAAKYNLEQRSTLPVNVKPSDVNLRKFGKPNVSECVKSIELKSNESFTQSDYSLESVKLVEASLPKKEESLNSIKKQTDRLSANLDSFKKEIKEANKRIEELYKIAEKSTNETTLKNKPESLCNNEDRKSPKQFGKLKEHFVPVKITNDSFYKAENINPVCKFIENKSVDVSKMSSSTRYNERIIPIEIESSEKPVKNVKYNSTVYIEEENYETEI